MAATVAAKPANVLSIFWQGRQAGLVFWELGGAWRHHPWQVLEGVGGKENQPRMLAVKSPGDTGNSWSMGAGPGGQCGGHRGLLGRWGRGSRMQVMVDALSADAEWCDAILRASPERPYLCLPLR